MALSVIVYPGDGVRTQFNIPFALGYIKESDVTARVDGEVDGVGNQIYRTLVFLSPEIVEVQGPVVPVGTNIIFERTVVQDELIVDYEDGDVINEDNMNTSQKQMIMLVHQVLDGRFAQFQSGFDMGGFRISGLGDPVDPADAANKRYVDGLISDGAANAAITVAARDAAIAARNAAQASQSAAASSASTATTQAADALASATAAANSASSASASKDAAALSASQAEASNVSAGNAASGAGASAGAAASSATQALAFRNQAEGFKNDAATSASDAAGSATAANTSRQDAQTAQIRAYNWAQAAENTQVNDTVRTGYSAYHWSAKAAASAAAAATFDPSAYVAKAGSTMSGSLNIQNPASSGRSVLGLKNSTGATTWMLTGGLDGTDTSFRILNGTGDDVLEMSTGGRIFTTYHGWLDEKFATKNARCWREGGIWEFGDIDPNYNNITADAPSPYVLVGLRSSTGTYRIKLRAEQLRNN